VDEATAGARRAYVAGDWTEFDRQLERHQSALADMRIVYMVPFARRGKASTDGGATGNAARRDRKQQATEKLVARAEARKLWQADPNLPLAEVARRLGTVGYPDSTIIGWVRDLKPTPPAPRSTEARQIRIYPLERIFPSATKR
jgi:hypothetical protein